MAVVPFIECFRTTWHSCTREEDDVFDKLKEAVSDVSGGSDFTRRHPILRRLRSTKPRRRPMEPSRKLPMVICPLASCSRMLP